MYTKEPDWYLIFVGPESLHCFYIVFSCLLWTDIHYHDQNIKLSKRNKGKRDATRISHYLYAIGLPLCLRNVDDNYANQLIISKHPHMKATNNQTADSWTKY